LALTAKASSVASDIAEKSVNAVKKVVSTISAIMSAVVMVGAGIFSGFGCIALYAYFYPGLNATHILFLGFVIGSSLSALLGLRHQKRKSLEDDVERLEETLEKTNGGIELP